MKLIKAILRHMKNPRVIAALTSILAMDPARGLAMVQMLADELQGRGLELSADKEWDATISTNKTADFKGSDFHFISEFGIASSPDDVTQENTIAVIPFLYPITKYDWYWAGTETKATILQKCLNNKNIVGIIQLMDTPGGEATAPECYVKVAETSDKPIITVVKDLCASAGYWIGSCGWKFYTTSKLSEVGSVGTYTTFVDFQQYYESLGINVKDIYATLSTEKNKSYREALKGNFKPLTAEIDYVNEFFIEQIMKFRGDKFDDKENVIHGQLYYSDAAEKHGLIDGMRDMDMVVADINELIISQIQSKMFTTYVN